MGQNGTVIRDHVNDATTKKRMTAIRLEHPSRLETMRLIDLPDPGEPGSGEIRVRLHANSLNYHDLGVVTGKMPEARASIPMSDGAGIVEGRTRSDRICGR